MFVFEIDVRDDRYFETFYLMNLYRIIITQILVRINIQLIVLSSQM